MALPAGLEGIEQREPELLRVPRIREGGSWKRTNRRARWGFRFLCLATSSAPANVSFMNGASDEFLEENEPRSRSSKPTRFLEEVSLPNAREDLGFLRFANSYFLSQGFRSRTAPPASSWRRFKVFFNEFLEDNHPRRRSFFKLCMFFKEAGESLTSCYFLAEVYGGFLFFGWRFPLQCRSHGDVCGHRSALQNPWHRSGEGCSSGNGDLGRLIWLM